MVWSLIVESFSYKLIRAQGGIVEYFYLLNRHEVTICTG